MKFASQLFVTTALLFALAGPATASPDTDHDEWIDVLSIDWGSHKPGASTSMGDGKYKDERGRYMVVQNGKVVVRGWDYKKYKGAGTPVRARPHGARDVKTRDDEEEAALLLPAVQGAREASQRSKPSSSSANEKPIAASRFGISMDGTEIGDEQEDPKRKIRAKPQEGVEPDEIDSK